MCTLHLVLLSSKLSTFGATNGGARVKNLDWSLLCFTEGKISRKKRFAWSRFWSHYRKNLVSPPLHPSSKVWQVNTQSIFSLKLTEVLKSSCYCTAATKWNTTGRFTTVVEAVFLFFKTELFICLFFFLWESVAKSCFKARLSILNAKPAKKQTNTKKAQVLGTISVTLLQLLSWIKSVVVVQVSFIHVLIVSLYLVSCDAWVWVRIFLQD